MPIYEYRCTECDKDFEATQRITEDPLCECIFCKGKVRKLISRSSFHLKGSGWYVTDYAKKSGDNGSKETSQETSQPPGKKEKSQKSDSGESGSSSTGKKASSEG